MSDITILYLLGNAAIVVVLTFLAFQFLRRREESFFRDDLWEKKRVEEARIYDAIDRIALTGPGEEEEETTEKVFRGQRPNSPFTGAKTDPMIRRPDAANESPFRAPRFGGDAYEVLGVPRHADAAMVQSAYKHWIKRYHPDRVQHLGAGYIRQATLRAELLNRAKAELLEKIK